MRLSSAVVLVLAAGLLAAPACQTSRKLPCPTDDAKGGIFGFLKKKKHVGTVAQAQQDGQGELDESATAAQADQGRSIGGGGFDEDKKGLIKKKKYKHLHSKRRTGQRSFLGVKF